MGHPVTIFCLRCLDDTPRSAAGRIVAILGVVSRQKFAHPIPCTRVFKDVRKQAANVNAENQRRLLHKDKLSRQFEMDLPPPQRA
jgi:hypothetical protein